MATTTGNAVEDGTRTALVTGGTGGMGRVIAGKLAADGFDVAVAYAGDMAEADATVGEIEARGRHGAGFAADIADEKAVSDLFDAVGDRFSHIDVVVNTAGINRPPLSILTWPTSTRFIGSTCAARSSSTSKAPGAFVTAARS